MSAKQTKRKDSLSAELRDRKADRLLIRLQKQLFLTERQMREKKIGKTEEL